MIVVIGSVRVAVMGLSASWWGMTMLCGPRINEDHARQLVITLSSCSLFKKLQLIEMVGLPLTKRKANSCGNSSTRANMTPYQKNSPRSTPPGWRDATKSARSSGSAGITSPRLTE